MLRQLDVKLLMQRIIFLEYSMTYLFEEYQLESMKINKPNTPNGLKEIRNKVSATN